MITAIELKPLYEALTIKTVERRITPIERRLIRSLNRIYRELAAGFIRRAKWRASGTIRESFITNIATAVKQSLSAVRKEVTSTIRNAYVNAFLAGWALSPIIDSPPATVDAIARRFTNGMQQSFDEHFNNAVTRIDAENQGTALKDVKKNFRQALESQADIAAKVVASDTVMAGVNEGLGTAAELAPVEYEKRWITAGDVRVDVICTTNAAEAAIKRNELFPSGHMYPPAHSRCRCVIDYNW